MCEPLGPLAKFSEPHIFRCVKHLKDRARRQRSRQRKLSLLPVVRRALAEEPVEKLCMQEVAKRSGVSLWALRYSFASGDTMFRDVMGDLVLTIAAKCRYAGLTKDSVLATILDFAKFSASLMSTGEYRDLLYFILRYGRSHPWLAEAHQQQVIQKLHEELDAAVFRTSQRMGRTVLFREGAARALLRSIETEFGLAPLLHPDIERSAESRERILREAAGEAFNATYLFEWDPADAA